MPTFHGTTLTVDVSVTASSGTATGTVQVSGAGGGCSVTLNSAGGGSCNIYNLPDGNYWLTASYAGTSAFGSSASSPSTAVTIGRAPVFVADNPSLTAAHGQSYSYTFRAVGSPGIHYSLSGGFPGLHINPFTGTVSGTVPNFGGSFTYSVIATNGLGAATAGPYTVRLNHHFERANIRTFLSCTSKVFTGQRGTCTLYVTNRGFSPAPGVTAQIALPSQLRADYCGFFNFNFNFGCRIFNNTAFENLGTLNAGQTKELTVVFTARTGFNLWGWHHGHRFTVRVVGSASSFGGFPFFQHPVSFSTAFVTIIPRGWWA
ncbi:MAG: Ig-like domain-containing protein [Streptosporangiaceae bacterium]